MLTRRAIVLSSMLALASVAGARPAAAQLDTIMVIVQVTDSAGRALGGANIQLLDRNGALTIGAIADAAGRARIPIFAGAHPVDIFVRHLGFKPYRRGLPLPLDESAHLAVLMVDERTTLDTVHVAARDAQWKRTYFIDSAAIAGRNRNLVRTGWEILKFMRGDIAYGRGFCPGVEHVFINGKWIIPEHMPTDDVLAMREHAASATIAPHIAANEPLTRNTTEQHIEVMSILASIKPEHIVEMTFRNCEERPLSFAHSTSALYVTLAPGIGWDPDRGSFDITKDRRP